ncbi:MAG: hypothetical protein HY824_08875, partial [Acidobacteria bacterium]|nr:hypothetical protein [Acidobacteriota bacterium]
MTAALLVGLLATGVIVLWHGHRVRRLADARLADLLSIADAAPVREEPRRAIQPFPPRYRVAVPATGVLTAAALWLLVGLPVVVAAAFGCLFAVLAHLVEDYRGEQQAAAIEAQLAAAIYLMVGSLRAGASLLAAFESAL